MSNKYNITGELDLKIALLFTGRNKNFGKVYNYFNQIFHSTDIEVDCFGHYWSDDFLRMIHMDEYEDELERIHHYDKKERSDQYHNIKKYAISRLIDQNNQHFVNHWNKLNIGETKILTSSSQLELLDMWEDLIKRTDPRYPQRLTHYITLMAQFVSYRYAMELFNNYTNSNPKVKYDLVIRWRWDLICHPLNGSFYKVPEKLKNNDFWIQSIDQHQKMLCDYFWGMTHDTAKSQGMKFYHDFKDIAEHRFVTHKMEEVNKQNGMYRATENMILQMHNENKVNLATLEDDNFHAPPLVTIIWRPGCPVPFFDNRKKQTNIDAVTEIAKDVWVNKDWANRVTQRYKDNSKTSDF